MSVFGSTVHELMKVRLVGDGVLDFFPEAIGRVMRQPDDGRPDGGNAVIAKIGG